MLNPNVPRPLAILWFAFGMLPALLVVLFAGLIALLALPLADRHREYALKIGECFTKFAAVLVGAQPWREGLEAEQHRPQLPPRSLPFR